MTDIWYTLGAMVADPTFFGVIATVHPRFTTVVASLTESGTVYPRPAAGLLNLSDTSSLRVALRNHAAGLTGPAPIISLYTAAKFTQLNATLPTFGNVFTTARPAFTAAGGSRLSSPALLTAAGASLVDANLANFFRGPGLVPGDPVPLQQQFGLTNTEMTTLRAYLIDPAFNTAQTNLLSASSWGGQQACVEVFVGYQTFTRAVV